MEGHMNQIPELISQRLNESLHRTFTKKRKVGQFWVSSSQVGGCKRQTYYDSVDPIDREDLDNDALAVIYKGRLIHQICQDIIRKEKTIKARAEVLFKKADKRLSGSIDNVITIDGKTYVFDYKTKSTSSMGWIIKNGPPLQDVMQVQAYMFAWDSSGGMLIYIDRDRLLDNATVSLHSVVVPRGDEVVKAWLDDVEEAWSTKTEPRIPDEYDQWSPPCSWCPYTERCYGMIPTEKEVHGDQVETEGLKPPPTQKKEVRYGW